jgi:hypothetical protein
VSGSASMGLLTITLSVLVVPFPLSAQSDASSNDLYQHALSLPAPEQRRALIDAAGRGSLDAAARMIELGMHDDLAQIDPQSPAVAAWAQSDRRIDGMTAVQVHAEVSARRAVAQPTADSSAVLLKARESIEGDSVSNPFMASTLAWLEESVDPKDVARAKALRADLSGVYVSFAEGKDPLVRGACFLAAGNCLRPDLSPPGDWTAAAALYARAADTLQAAGDPAQFSSSLHLQGWCTEPDHDPHGDWTKAAEFFDRAARLREQAGDFARCGTSLFQLGCCLEPANNPAGSWSRAAEVFARSADAKAEAGDRAGCGKSLYEQAWCLTPAQNPAGDWSQAAELFARAAELREPAGDIKGAGWSLQQQAFCLIHGGKDRTQSAKARELLVRARELLAKAKDTAGVATVEKWIGSIDRG